MQTSPPRKDLDLRAECPKQATQRTRFLEIFASTYGPGPYGFGPLGPYGPGPFII